MPPLAVPPHINKDLFRACLRGGLKTAIWLYTDMYRLFIVEDDSGIANAIKSVAEPWDTEAHIATDFRNILAELPNNSRVK